MGLVILVLVIALACLFVGIFVQAVKWLIIIGIVLFVVGVISGVIRGRTSRPV